MKSRAFIAAIAFGTSLNASAFNEPDAVKLVRTYSKLVACGTEESKFIGFRLFGSSKEENEGDRYAVLWTGDMGCAGGNATIFPQITVIEIRGHSTPQVIPDFKIPNIDLVTVMRAQKKDGAIIIEGIVNTGDPKRPTKPSTVVLKINEAGEFVSAKK